MSALDSDYLNRAAPPGSMRYFALLYTESARRDLLTALFVIEAEIRACAAQVAHEVAHTRLQWWRAEIDRLVNRNAHHPAAKLLQDSLPSADFGLLYEVMTSADMDVACMTYNKASELNAYLERSGGILELFAIGLPEEIRRRVRTLGALIRRVETLRDLVAEARAGRVYWPLDQLEESLVTLDQLRSGKPTEAIVKLLATEVSRLLNAFDEPSNAIANASLRPLIVLAQLHRKLLLRIARAGHDVFTQRHELGPIEKVWTAWRAARRS